MTAYTAVIWAEKRDGSFRNVVTVTDDEDGSLTLPAIPVVHPDAPGAVESGADRVLAENGWRVTGSWNEAGNALYAPAERT